MKIFSLLRSALVAIGLLAAWNFFFWKQTPGINCLLFALLVMGVLLLTNRGAWRRKMVRVSGLLTLLAATMVTLHGPGWAVAAYVFSLLLFPVFVLDEKFHSVFFAFTQAFVNVFAWPGELVRRWRKNSSGNFRLRKAGYWFRIVFLPLLVAIVFFLLYSAGNRHFSNSFAGFFDWISDLFDQFNWQHAWFVVWGIFVCGALLLHLRTGLEEYDLLPDEMKRVKKQKSFFTGMSVLRREVKTGIVLLVLLNALLLLLNILDLQRVWIRFVVPEHFSLKNFVHEGTWILMSSIGLSLLVLLWIFRGNMHFFRENRWLKKLSYVWIAQNVFLALSLFKRNYQYIAFHGLAYGRIVVIAFLLMTLFGLFAFWWKIRHNRSFYFLLRVNSWAAYLLIVAMSCVNWDKTIVDFNLHHPNVNEIDVDFYLSAGEDVMPLIASNMYLVQRQISAHQENEVIWIDIRTWKGFSEMFNHRKNNFVNRQRWKDWQSWNYADASAAGALEGR